MAIKDKSSAPAPVAVSFAVLPSRYPELPDDVLHRFPSMRDWYDEVQRLHNRVSEAIDSTAADLEMPVNELKTTTRGLSAASGDLSARIADEKQARIDGDAALATTIASIVAAAGTTSTVFVQSATPTANSVNDIWVDPSNGFALKYWNGTAWTDMTDTRLTGAVSAITAESSVRSSADSALASSITSLASTVSSNQTAALAAISTESSTRASADTALSSSITTLTSAVNIKTQTFAQSTAPTAGAVGDIWVDTANGNILKRWNGATWAAFQDAAISTAQNTADSKAKTFVAGSAPTASAVGDIWVDTANGNALKRWNGTSWADTTIASGAISAAVAVEASARAAADGSLYAKWGVAININGNVVGRINLDGTNQSSEFSVDATKFTVWNGTSNVPPFQVIGGVVRVASLSLLSADISDRSLANIDSAANTKLAGISAGADVTLSAINGGLVITSGGITLNGTPTIKSNNYVANTSGWVIKGDGTVEFASGTFRGTVSGADIIVSSALGMRYIDDNHVFTICGGSTNGVSHGAQIDLAGTGAAGSVDGVLVLAAGDSANGSLRLRTGTSVDRIVIEHNGFTYIKKVTGTGAGLWYDGDSVAGRAFLGMDAGSNTVFRLYSTIINANVFLSDLSTGDLQLGRFLVDNAGNPVVGNRGARIADPGIATIAGTGDDFGINSSLQNLQTALRDVISRMVAHGLISP